MRIWRSIATYLAALYIGAGLFGGITMATFLPLNAFGVAYYTLTWPEHLYCAQPHRQCAPILSRLPAHMQAWFFDLDREAAE